jgi:hypothetical protein
MTPDANVIKIPGYFNPTFSRVKMMQNITAILG